MEPFPKSSSEPDLLSRVDSQSLENLSQELQEQQEKLIELKHRQEEIERRKRELEELNRKRQELTVGQKEMKERLTRAVAILENAEYDARKEIEQIQVTYRMFTEHLDAIEAIDPNKWPTETIDDQLTKSLSRIDHARAVYAQARVRIDALSGKDIDGDDDETDDANGEEADGSSFTAMFIRGLAFNLPLIIALLLIFIFLLVKKAT